ncbi:hypothetical protein K440DRAFT_660796 [Wilcoxina mikolae CBS 423.85]|nr:hypothetical protein K440DRAFT_660796 [Wilcoxina mikolae CBS 423.85]
MDEVHDSTVLAVVFYAIHGLGKKIPNEIDFSHLYDISVLCEKYRCATIMQPWCGNWVERLRSTIDKPENGGWLYIAWVFGLDDVFQTLTRRLITSTVIGGYGRFIISEDDRNPTVLGEHIPRDVIWKISEKESDARRQMVEACRSLYQLYCNPSDENCVQSCTTAAGRKLCSRLIFADLYWGFMSINMLENNNIKIPSIPLTTVVRDINKVLGSMEAIPQTTGVEKFDHSLCIRQVKETNRAVQTILGKITLDLSKCGWKEESRESVVVDPYDDDYY